MEAPPTYLKRNVVNPSLDLHFESAGQQAQPNAGATQSSIVECPRARFVLQWAPWVAPMPVLPLLTHLKRDMVHPTLETILGGAGQQVGRGGASLFPAPANASRRALTSHAG